MKKSLYILLFCGIIVLAFFLRFYQLGQIPVGMDSDETSIGYNAYSILRTGKDEYGNFMPLYFTSFGDEKLPVYIYLTAGSIKFFGVNAFAVRLPSAFFGSLTIIILYFLLYDLSKKRAFAFIGSFLLAINPWHLFFSRAALEDNVALFFAVLGTWLFIRAMHTKNGFLLSAAIIGFMGSFYSYNVARLLSPLLLFLLIFYYRKSFFAFPKKILAIAGILFFLLLLPFLITIFTAGGVASTKGALITSSDITAQYLEWRSYLVALPSLVTKVLFNQFSYIFWQYIENIFAFFSPSFFFITGSPHGYPGIGNFGMFYLFECPAIIAGIIYFFKNKINFLKPFFFWFIITLLVASLSKTVPHVTRGYFLLLPLSIFSSYGFYLFTLWVWRNRRKIYVPVSVFLVCYSIVYFVSFYFTSYYVRFPIAYASDWSAEDESLVNYLETTGKSYQHIIIDTNSPFRYSALLFYTQYPPSAFQSQQIRYPIDGEGFHWVKSFGKYEFKKIDWKKDMNTSNSLIITTKENVPQNIPMLAVFSYPTRPVVLSIQEQTYQFPVTDNAYVVISTKK